VDIVARLGGDEFVILAPDASGESVDTLVERLQTTLQVRNQQSVRPYKLNVSLGIANYDPQAPCSLDELITRADADMYKQKQARISE